MANYFDQFPLIPYNINKSDRTANEYEQPVNIFVRFRVLVEKLDQAFHYYEYTIKDGDTPEILAEKVYGNAEAHWLIMMTNNIVDPLYDWPLAYDAYNNYITNKYGSAATAATTVHHYEQIQIIEDLFTGEVTTNKFEISALQYAASTLPTSPGAPTIAVINGKTVNITEYKTTVYCDVYEEELNESKRQIKLIKPNYYPIIKNELINLLSVTNTSRMIGRRVVV